MYDNGNKNFFQINDDIIVSLINNHITVYCPKKEPLHRILITTESRILKVLNEECMYYKTITSTLFHTI